MEMVEYLDDAVMWATAVVTAAAAFAAVTPTQVDDKYASRAKKYLNMFLRIVNVVGLNVNKAKNADDKP